MRPRSVLLALMGAGVASVLAVASGAPGAQPGGAPKAAASATAARHGPHRAR